MKMVEEGVIENFVFKINPEVFGVQTCYVRFICPQKFKCAEHLNVMLGADPRFTEIMTGTDGTTIIHVFGQGEQLNNAIEFLKKKLKDFTGDPLIIKRYKPPFKEGKINNSLLKVINCLIEDVRMPIADIAAKCNMTSKSVKYYIDQIESLNIGRFSINLQPYKISKRIFVSIFLSKPNTDYIHFSSLFDKIKTEELKKVIVKDYLLVEPPGIFLNLTVESLEEIDIIEKNIHDFFKENYSFWKMFPSRTIYRNSLIHQIIKDRISNLASNDDESENVDVEEI
jgi:DNA-binding Lrp family transcriptional regulator